MNKQSFSRIAGVGSLILFALFCAWQSSRLRHDRALERAAAIAAATAATNAAAVSQATATLPGVERKPGNFVLALTSDAQGCIWVGTEGEGIFRYSPAAP